MGRGAKQMQLKLPANFTLPSAAAMREPKFLVRAALGLLLAANLFAAAFAFHVIGDSPEALNQQLAGAIAEKQRAQATLTRSRALTGSIDKGKGEGERF